MFPGSFSRQYLKKGLHQARFPRRVIFSGESREKKREGCGFSQVQVGMEVRPQGQVKEWRKTQDEEGQSSEPGFRPAEKGPGGFRVSGEGDKGRKKKNLGQSMMGQPKGE